MGDSACLPPCRRSLYQSILLSMLDRTALLNIISRRRNDLVAKLTRCGLAMLTPAYRLAIGLRNRRFDRAKVKADPDVIQKAEIPVISVGNLTTGGTGKTPLVIRIAQHLRAQQQRVAILSRGYQGSQGSAGGRNDEALEMEIRLPDVPHLQDPDRHRIACIAAEELESQVLLLDDGFQHRQLHRDLDIILIDATEPFGYERLLPRGLLREPIASLARCQQVIITRCQLVSEEQLSAIESRIKTVRSDLPIAKTETEVRSLLRHDGSEEPLSHLANEKLFAFCGIGNPDGFMGTLQQKNLQVVGSQLFEDHHNYTRQDIESLVNQARSAGASALICTHKDLVKIGVNQYQELPFFALLIDTKFTAGETEFFARIDKVIRNS